MHGWCGVTAARVNSSKCRTVSKRLTNYYAQELSIYALMIQEVINDVMSNDAIVSSPHSPLFRPGRDTFTIPVGLGQAYDDQTDA